MSCPNYSLFFTAKNKTKQNNSSLPPSATTTNHKNGQKNDVHNELLVYCLPQPHLSLSLPCFLLAMSHSSKSLRILFRIPLQASAENHIAFIIHQEMSSYTDVTTHDNYFYHFALYFWGSFSPSVKWSKYAVSLRIEALFSLNLGPV